VDGNGIPLACSVTGANRHDVTELLPLADAVPPVAGKPGRPRRRPAALYGDRAYDSPRHEAGLRRRGIRPVIAQQGAPHGSGLGKVRWVVERTLSWLHQFRRLRVRYDRRADIHQAFVTIGCILIAARFLTRSFC
jgi:transposase